MLKLPTLQGKYSVIFSGDSALNLPEIPTLSEQPTADEQLAHDAAVKQREKLLEVARDTGRWDEILHVGQTPTIFEMKPIRGHAYNWLLSEIQQRPLTTTQALELACRMALSKIENLPGVTIEFEVGDRTLVSEKTIDQLFSIDKNIVLELGAIAFNKAKEALAPKS